MNHKITWFRATALLALLVALIGGSSEVHAQSFRMLQHFLSGRHDSGFNFVSCSDPNGFTHWNKRSISIYHNTSNQGSGKAAALQAAMQTWTNVPDTTYALSYAGTTSAGYVTDSKSTMVWITNGACINNCLGLTALVLQQPGQVIIESDVVFNNGVTWTTTGGIHDTQATATHELGHLLGIAHATCIGGPLTMCEQPDNSQHDIRTLETEDKNALLCSEYRYCPSSATPMPPLNLTAYNGNCYGHNDLIWSSTCEGTTRYELYRSTSPSFSSQTLESSGLNLLKHVVVSQTSYYRIRACNANGCGGYRVADGPAYYHPWCY